MKQTLETVCGARSDELFKPLTLSLFMGADTKAPSKRKGFFRASSKSSKTAKKTGTHTLLSTGVVKDKKNNEYFGGDSTVTLAGDEDEE